MNKKMKVILITVFVLLVCIYIILFVLTQRKKTMLDEIEYEEGSLVIEYNSVERVQNKTEFFLVNQCINKFYSKYLKDSELYDLLDQDYIDLFDLKEEASEKYKIFSKVITDITDMYVSNIGNGINVYFAYGYVINKENKEVNKLKIGVKTDNKSNTFSILPYEYLEEKGYLEVDETTKLDFEETEKIKNKTINTFKYKNINDEDYINYIFSNYINRCFFNPEQAYEHLDVEYRKKRFGNMEGFEEYLNNKKKIYELYDKKNAKQVGDFNTVEEFEEYINSYRPLEIESYEKKSTDEYTQYVLVDNFDNYYIFRENYTMHYSLILDTYTIDIPEFIEKYDSVNVKERAGLNTKKFIDAINEHDYKYAYSCLADQFKENKFDTLESFTEYVQNNFFDRNEFEFTEFNNEGDIYIFSIKITDATRQDSREAILQVIMELKEDRSFVMAFNIQ